MFCSCFYSSSYAICFVYDWKQDKMLVVMLEDQRVDITLVVRTVSEIRMFSLICVWNDFLEQLKRGKAYMR